MNRPYHLVIAARVAFIVGTLLAATAGVSVMSVMSASSAGARRPETPARTARFAGAEFNLPQDARVQHQRDSLRIRISGVGIDVRHHDGRAPARPAALRRLLSRTRGTQVEHEGRGASGLVSGLYWTRAVVDAHTVRPGFHRNILGVRAVFGASLPTRDGFVLCSGGGSRSFVHTLAPGDPIRVAARVCASMHPPVDPLDPTTQIDI